jgi:hypothetical protein
VTLVQGLASLALAPDDLHAQPTDIA